MTTSDPVLDREAVGRAPGVIARLGLPALDIAAVPAAIVTAPTVALSAFLLFTIEPLVGRLALPAFGGSPGVWAAVLAFFQAVLLAGYLYGHLSVTRLGLRRGAVVHVGLAVVAMASLAVAPAHVSSLRDESITPILDLLRSLTLTIGLPAFVLTATTPLLTAWYAALAGGRPGATEDPYWLYALSNGGSFLALLAYPFLVEPTLGLTAQRASWTLGFATLCLALTAGAVALWARPGPRSTADDSDRAKAVVAEPIDRGRRLRWLLLAAVPAGLLAAVTNEIATDLISAPMLWVGPLAIYLASFVVAFSARGRRTVPAAVALAPVAITLLWVPLGSAAAWPILPLLLLEYAGLAVVATALHGRLAFDRPSVERSTEFYLALATGGVIGGAFVGIVAPVAFQGVWEYPILLVAGLIALAWSTLAPAATTRLRRRLDLRPFVAGAPRRLFPYLAVAALLALSLALDGSIATVAGIRWLLVGGLVLLVGARPGFLAAATALVLVLSTFVIPRDIVYQDRSFFGVSQVIRVQGSDQTQLMNGTTLHGMQWDDPVRRLEPTTYYARSGPAGDVFAALGDTGSTGRSVGIVGLGAGALAAYERPIDRFTFYEIDPVVIHVATDPAYFTYLSDAPVPPAIVAGDARLTLDHVATSSEDLLVLDAFSADSIPVHLLTVEAFQTYARVVPPDGLLAVHVSNRYYDLAPAVAASARAVGLTAMVRSYVPSREEAAAGASPSIWVVAARDPSGLAPFAARGWTPVAEMVAPPTDDRPDLLRFLRLSL